MNEAEILELQKQLLETQKELIAVNRELMKARSDKLRLGEFEAALRLFIENSRWTQDRDYATRRDIYILSMTCGVDQKAWLDRTMKLLERQ